MGVTSAWTAVFTNDTSTTYLDTDTAPGVCYQYRVTAGNVYGFSAAVQSPWMHTPAPPEPHGIFWLAETFYYPNATNNAPLANLGKGFGWKPDAWTATIPATFMANAIMFSDYSTSGGGLRGNGNGVVTRPIRRAPELGSTLWISALLYLENADYDRCTRLSFTNAQGEKFVMNIGTWDAPPAALVWVNTAAPNSVNMLNAKGWITGKPLLLIAKFTRLGEGSPEAPQRATMWLVDAAQYDAIKDGGIIEAELDINCLARVYSSHNAPVTLARGDVFTLRTNGIPVRLDEFKAASTLTSVLFGDTPPSDIQPPSLFFVH